MANIIQNAPLLKLLRKWINCGITFRSLKGFRSLSLISKVKQNYHVICKNQLCSARLVSVNLSKPCNDSFLNIALNDSRVEKHLNSLVRKYEETGKKLKLCKEKEKFILKQTLNDLQPLIYLKLELENCESELKELDKMISEIQEDEDFLETALKEKESCLLKIEKLRLSILDHFVPEEAVEEKDIIIELSAGVGGQEAMLFTKDIFDMYCQYASFRGWSSEILKYSPTDIGGLHNAHIAVSGQHAYKLFKFEAGVHRVQRIPKTEKAGRVHTSTVTVAVLPQPTEIDIVLNPKDIEMVFKRSGGAGGQHVNTTDSCVRLTHIPTGITVERQVERCQHKNRELAFKSLRAKLYQRELDMAVKEQQQNRKLMVGSSARSDKIRTYNFPQDRITDHRIPQNVYNVELFLQGAQNFHNLLQILQEWSEFQILNEILSQYDE